MECPKVSVVIPALNAGKTIADQLQSVLSQDTSEPFEVIVADNGSNDDTRDVVSEFAQRDARVRLVDASEAPLGGAAAKNFGVMHAEGEWLAFCDADDLVAPGWLAGILDGLSVAPVVAVVRDYRYLNAMNAVIRDTAGLDYVMHVPILSGGAFGIHRDLYWEVGGFDEHLSGAVDTEFSLRLHAVAQSAPIFLEESVVYCRLPTSSLAGFRRSVLLGRSLPKILDRHRSLFPERNSFRIEVGRWAWLVRHAGMAFGGRRSRWIGYLGTSVGRLQGQLFVSAQRFRDGRT